MVITFSHHHWEPLAMDLTFPSCGRLDKGLYGAALLMPQLARAEIPVHIRSPPKPCVVAGETSSSRDASAGDGNKSKTSRGEWLRWLASCSFRAMELRKSRSEVMGLSVHRSFFGATCDGSQ